MTDMTQKREQCFEMLNELADTLLNEFNYAETYSASDYRQNPSMGGRMITLTDQEVMFVGRKETDKYTLFSEVRMDVESKELKIRAVIQSYERVRIRTTWVSSTISESKVNILNVEEVLWRALKRDRLEVDCI